LAGHSSYHIGFPRKNNFLTAFVGNLVIPASIAIAPLDVLLYRSGIYIILTLIFCVFLTTHKTFKMVALFLPMFGGIIALLLAMMWPDFRHIWFISVIFMFTVPLGLAHTAKSNA